MQTSRDSLNELHHFQLPGVLFYTGLDFASETTALRLLAPPPSDGTLAEDQVFASSDASYIPFTLQLKP